MTDQRIQGTSRRDEEKHLEKTLSVIRANVEEYDLQVQKMKADIDEMLEHYHDNDVEVYTILSNTVTLHDHMKQTLLKNMKALDKPYFGRIDFHDQATNRDESLYIGRGGISRDTTHQEVVDWRAPVAKAYYENGLGKCSYAAPDGVALEIDLELKRTYEIEKGVLLDFFDSEIISNDELLTKYLARNKQAVLGEIVATIQKEQNEIIRRSPYHNTIVQGVAGSGKTTVAMHRISFILYNYAERFRPEDFYIVGSNRIMLNYITGVLPDLDVYGVHQMTMEQLFVRLLYEDWDENKYSIKKGDQSSDRGKQKGDAAWFEDLKRFCDALERDSISTESVYLNPRQFVEGLKDGKNGVYDRSTDQDPLILLLEGEAVERYITGNPDVSIQSKINMLNERLTKKIQDEFLGKGIKYTEEERKAILKAYRNRYGGRTWKHSTYELYRKFLLQQKEKGAEIQVPDREFDVYDLAALAYIYKRTKETEIISEAHHIVIDEAQDFGMMVYHCLHSCIHGCTYTIMGDVSQNIHFGFGLNDWEPLKDLLLSDSMDHFDILKKSYRNTVEISDFATAILRHGRFFSYPVEPIIRHGSEVRVNLISSDAIYQETAKICRDWQERGLATIALICRNINGAQEAAKRLSTLIPVLETDLEKTEFGNGVMILPVEYTKGLEFDAVLILDPTREEYPVDDGHAKLLYVAATRALHELCVLHAGNLTGLIADPVPEADSEPKKTLDRPFEPVPEEGRGKPEIYNPEEQSVASGTAEKLSLNRHDTPTQRKRLKVKIVPKPTVSQETPEHVKPKTSYAVKPVPTSVKEENMTLPTFGTQVPDQKLQLSGHTRIDLSVRWIYKDSDGLYLQSRYGILHIKPITGGIIRVTFTRNGQHPDVLHPMIAVDSLERFWTYKDTGMSVELTTDELILRIDKSTGHLCYFDRDKRPLLAERDKESRQLEDTAQGFCRNRLFLKLDKKEQLYAVGSPEKAPLPLRGTSLYITPENRDCAEADKRLPLLFSDRGYGLLIPTDEAVFFCDASSGGPYICTEGQVQMDMYFIAGKDIEALEDACRYLYGRL